MKDKLFNRWHLPSETIKNGNAEYYIRRGIKFQRIDYNGRVVHKIFATYGEYYSEINSYLELLLIDADIAHPNWVIFALHNAKNLKTYEKIYQFVAANRSTTMRELRELVADSRVRDALAKAVEQPAESRANVQI